FYEICHESVVSGFAWHFDLLNDEVDYSPGNRFDLVPEAGEQPDQGAAGQDICVFHLVLLHAGLDRNDHPKVRQEHFQWWCEPAPRHEIIRRVSMEISMKTL